MTTSAADKLEMLVNSLSRKRQFAQDSIEQFAEKLISDPAYTLEWSGNTFTEAATIQVANWILAYVEKGKSWDELSAILLAEVLRRSRYVESSSSPMANLMANEITAQFARIYEDYFID